MSERDEKTARQNFPKPGQNPQILIVTDKPLGCIAASLLSVVFSVVDGLKLFRS